MILKVVSFVRILNTSHSDSGSSRAMRLFLCRCSFSSSLLSFANLPDSESCWITLWSVKACVILLISSRVCEFIVVDCVFPLVLVRDKFTLVNP